MRLHFRTSVIYTDVNALSKRIRVNNEAFQRTTLQALPTAATNLKRSEADTSMNNA